MRTITWFLLVLLLFGVLAVAFDGELFVGGSVTIRVPQDYATIQAAINAATAGDTIIVSEGVYAEGQINVSKSLTLQANGTVIVDGLQIGHVFHVWVNYVTIRGFTIQNSGNSDVQSGIYLDCNMGCLIEGNVVIDNQFGISGNRALSNVISNNGVANNSWHGIYFHGSADNLIIGNKVVNNTITGIVVNWVGDNNTIVDNFIANNYCGIGQGNTAGDNTITGNTIVGNSIGISFGNSYHNKVFHNNFINNTQQASPYSDSDWDDVYPSGGNYWSDYTGVDFYRGPYQNETGSDGIGDTAYTITPYVRDNYPLMKPFPWHAHDIALTRLATSKTVVDEGSDLNVSVMTFNYGNTTENFNVTVYANTTTIATFTNITLERRNSTTINFTWNTSGFAKGNYTLRAYASPVQNETDTTDNTRIDSQICITILGDVNGDRTINFLDAILLGVAYNSEPTEPNWNPNADLNNDNVVNFLDAIILGANFGQSWT